MHIFEAILALIGTLALGFGGFVVFASSNTEEDVSGGLPFIGCGFAVVGALLIGLAIALRVLV